MKDLDSKELLELYKIIKDFLAKRFIYEIFISIDSNSELYLVLVNGNINDMILETIKAYDSHLFEYVREHLCFDDQIFKYVKEILYGKAIKKTYSK